MFVFNWPGELGTTFRVAAAMPLYYIQHCFPFAPVWPGQFFCSSTGARLIDWK